MYIQITDHCNMTCAHCGYGCSPEKNNFITVGQFNNAISIASEIKSQFLTIGGGEPTLHPDFWKFFDIAINRIGAVSIVTNGTQYETCKSLFELSEKDENISVCVTLDKYHDSKMIDKRLFKHIKNKPELRKKNTNVSITPIGRAKSLSRKTNSINNGKCCFGPNPTMFVNGNIGICGCPDTQIIGNIKDNLRSDLVTKLKDIIFQPEFEEFKCSKGYNDYLLMKKEILHTYQQNMSKEQLNENFPKSKMPGTLNYIRWMVNKSKEPINTFTTNSYLDVDTALLLLSQDGTIDISHHHIITFLSKIDFDINKVLVENGHDFNFTILTESEKDWLERFNSLSFEKKDLIDRLLNWGSPKLLEAIDKRLNDVEESHNEFFGNLNISEG